MRSRSDSSTALCSAAAAMPRARAAVTWSCMSAIRGDTTSVRPPRHERRDLEADRLSAAGRENGQRVPPGEHRPDDRQLSGTEVGVAEVMAQQAAGLVEGGCHAPRSRWRGAAATPVAPRDRSGKRKRPPRRRGAASTPAEGSVAAEADADRDRDELGVAAAGEHVVEPTFDEQTRRSRLEVEAGAGIDAELGLGVDVRPARRRP